MWAYLKSLNWEESMLPLARVMAHYELLEKQLASERARADHELKERCKMAIDRNFLKLALGTERALADRLAQTLRDIEGRCGDTTIMLHPDADAKGCVDDCWEWSEQALATWKEARRA